MRAIEADQPRADAAAGSSAFAMSIDVEDYFQVWAFADAVDQADWDGFEMRCDRSTRRILDRLDAAGATATFFTLGWVAEKCPDLIRDIHARGHEVASHGYAHVKVFDQTREEFLEDVRKTKAILEDLTAAPVTGYRAAGFSIDQRTPWAHEALAEAGYRYSSSSHPIAHDHYGDPDAPRTPHRPVPELIEAPVATADVFGKRISVAGGGWFRAAPYAPFKALLKRAAADLDGPTIFYFHPWEIDPAQPRIKGASLKSSLRHYLNLDAMERKIVRLLQDFHWTRIDHALADQALTGQAAGQIADRHAGDRAGERVA